MSLRRSLLLVLLAGSVAVVPSLAEPEKRFPSPAHEFELEDINPRSETFGRKLSLSDLYEERGLVLQFTASWCNVCRKELPHLQELYAGGETPIVFLAADENGRSESILIVAERSGLTAPLLFVPASRTVEFEMNYRYRVLPATYVIDRAGKILDLHQGALSADRLGDYARKALGL